MDARSLSLALVSLWLCSSVCGAQAPPPASPSQPTTNEDQTAELFLWSVSKDGATSHILGTCHVGIRLADALPGDTRLTLQTARRVILEADIASSTTAIPEMLLPEGERLSELLSETAWENLQERSASIMPVDALDRLRPWVASTLAGAGQSPASSSAPPMDLAILQAARLAGTPALFLETMSEQAQTMNSLPQAAFVEALEESLAGDGSVDVDAITEMLEAYRSGDTERILSLIQDADIIDQVPEFRQRLLIDRNQAWMPRLLDWFQQEDTFVAVGLGHLLGEGGVLELLQEGGYTIARIARPDPGSTPTQETPQSDLPSEHVPEVAVNITPDSDVYTGDLVTVRILATAAQGDEVTVPEQTLSPFEVYDRRSSERRLDDSRTEYTYEIDLIALEPGVHTLGPLRLRVMTDDGTLGASYTDAHTIEVKSLLANEPNAEPKPTTEPVMVRERDETLLWATGLLALVLFTALITVLASRWWAKRPRPEAPPPPPRPAWDVANERLALLQEQLESSFADGHAVEWMDELNDVLRAFVGARFGFEGLESTTDEINARLRRSNAPAGFSSEAALVLGECDLVQFARAPAELEIAAQLLQRTRRLVEWATPKNSPSPRVQLEGGE